MRQLSTAYLKRASKRFLAGTRFKAPVDAVLSGARALSDWATTLTEERELERERQKTIRSARRARFSAFQGVGDD